MPGIVLRTWRDVNRNIDTYAREFGDNFILINNDPSNANKSFSSALVKPYIEQSTATGKPKTPEEQAKFEVSQAYFRRNIANAQWLDTHFTL